MRPLSRNWRSKQAPLRQSALPEQACPTVLVPPRRLADRQRGPRPVGHAPLARAGQSLSRAQEVAAIFDDGVQYPTLAAEPSGAVTVVYSRQLDDVGQSASLRHIVLQKG